MGRCPSKIPRGPEQAICPGHALMDVDVCDPPCLLHSPRSYLDGVVVPPYPLGYLHTFESDVSAYAHGRPGPR